MLLNIVIGLGTMAICLFLEGLLLALALKYYLNHQHEMLLPAVGKTMTILCGVMVLLVVGNLIQIGVWAGLFELLAEFENYSTAFYHSAVNFSTLGYGDLVMTEKHRLLGPLEAVNGILMVGVSTAALIAIFQDAIKKKLQ